MKVKVSKKGKTKNYKVISSWDEVTLEKWVKLASLEKLSNSKEAQGLIEALSDLPNDVISKLSIQNIAVLLDRIAEVQAQKDDKLKKFITIEGKEYGFHPSLSEITLGEYADIETFIQKGLGNYLPEIMAILYRPIVERKNNAYIIEPYDGKLDVRAEQMKKMKAAEVESALVFFWNFVKELLKILPSFLMELHTERQKDLRTKILAQNGVTSA